ncbi:hypothetical protein H6P81_008140 [Aristolochia fimbriata]|uniref:Vacuolar protein sorting-associated protein 13 VPS13 adaptor binding domain-containing protein n=1 Tax=Aristolochia fimbriata TaxID=158543 RepID=A0AAV7F5X2_ARIFI|nr:hypothetical protein H6P81_008140 [Aristolochia fimbriata]
MFEGLVRQLLEGFLGSHVKNFEPDQLKVRLLKEKLVKLEKLELIPEAFDYLQLPFALKEGRIGSLSIEFLWKRHKPIKIVIKDVTICIGKRDECEWSFESIERREFAAKNAKLAAAELAKLSRRVSDNQAGQIFSSFISAKILDGIQVSIQNVCVQFTDGHNDLTSIRFGLRLSNLELKQNSVGSYSLKILGLAFYCNSLDELDDVGDSEPCYDQSFDSAKYEYMLEPFDATVSLVVNKSGKLDEGIPQYSISAELTGLVMLLNETQLRHILIFIDYLGMSAIREKYARYRPWKHPRKVSGWERVWWHYAQESVLLDVRKKLWKTSWSKFGQRINYRRKYVELYMEKLAFLFGEQSVSEGSLQKLEQMEKESDVDDILTYRAIAESRRQESSSNIKTLTIRNLDAAQEKQQPDDKTSNKQRGWLNWLSLGMLGAAGTVNCSQFSGVVPDEIVKDIFEATDFHPGASFDGGTGIIKDKLYLSSIKFSIHQIVSKLRSKTCDREIVHLICYGVITEYKVWEDAAEIVSSVKSMEMVNPCSGGLMFNKRKDLFADESSLVKEAAPFVSFQVKSTPINSESEVSVKVVFQPFELDYDPDVLRHALDTYHVLRSIQFQSERVLSSLNRFEDHRSRLISKAEYVFLSRKKISVDVSFSNISIKIPWRSQDSQSLTMVLDLGDLIIQSIPGGISFCLTNEDQFNYLLNSNLTSEKIFAGLQLKDLYNYFKVKLTNSEVKMFMPHIPEAVIIVENFGASVTFASCLFQDECTLKNVEVSCDVDSLGAHFSTSIYDALIKMGSCLELALASKTQAIDSSNVFKYFLSLHLSRVVLDVHLEDKTEESLLVAFSIDSLSIRCSQEEYLECWICMKVMEVNACSSTRRCAPLVLCSCRNSCAISPSKDVDLDIASEVCTENKSSADGCFLLHYESWKCAYTISLSNMDIHCYPRIIGLLRVFFGEISELGGFSSSYSIDNFMEPCSEIDECGIMSRSVLKFGFSNYYENGSNRSASIPVGSFPFVTISKKRSVDLDRSLILAPLEWRRNSSVKSRNTVRGQKCNVWKRSKKGDILQEKSVLAEYSHGRDLCLLDFNVNDIKAHFHDSSCIVGSLTVPAASCLIFSEGPNCWDVLASVDGLQLSSSWSIPSIHDIIWGPVLSEVSPILNLRIKKRNDEAPASSLEIYIAVQHVCCILSPDYLAILIGYFSLSDWKWDPDEPVPDDLSDDQSITPVYKVEVLDSSVVIPINGVTWHTLQLGLQQLCCSLVLKGIPKDALEGIPKECVILADHIADRIHRVNVFGDGLSLSLMFLDAVGKLDQSHLVRSVPLISELNADLWIRIPIISKHSSGADSSPSSVMMTADVCQLIAEEKYFLSGLESLIKIIDELCMVGRYSKIFVSDILRFRQSKKGLKVDINENSDGTVTKIKFHANAFSVKLTQSGKGESELSRLVAEAEMKLSLAVTLDNDVPTCLDATLSGLSLYSFHNSVILVSCSSSDEISSCLDIHFFKSDRGLDELLVATQSLNCWLQLSDWNELITLIGLFTEPSARNSSNINSSEGTSKGSILKDGKPQCMPSSLLTIEPDESNLIVKSENISITFHFPLFVEESQNDCGHQTSHLHRQKHSGSTGKNCKSVAFSLYSRSIEAIVSERLVKIRSSVDKIDGMLEATATGYTSSLPFFQIMQVNLTGEVCKEFPQLSFELFVGTVNLWVSHQILYFWHGVTFKNSEKVGSAQVPSCVTAFKLRLKKASLLLSDGRWSCNGPLLEILVKNLVTEVSSVEGDLETLVDGDLLVYYNNIHKVMWEPFVEPWSFQLKLEQKNVVNALMNKYIVTDIHLRSRVQLNLNITEPLIETLFRGNEIIQDSLHQIGLHHHFEDGATLVSHAIDSMHARRYAPYMLKNDTSVPLLFWVSSSSGCEDDIDTVAMNKGSLVQPGSSVPIYINQSPKELLHHRPTHSTEKLNEKKLTGVSHHMISVQLDGTSGPSQPMSMDLVGLRYFEVDFSQPTDILEVDMVRDSVENKRKIEERSKAGLSGGFVVPVVFEVSIQQHSKLIRLYSTVVLLNATSMPLELRFDIPFGVSPMVLDPIFPGKEFPLPVHLAESGRMRWRPLGTDYLWSEAHALSNILSQENRSGILRSFVCYPSNPSTGPFRCCISIQDINLPKSSDLKKFLSHHVLENVTEFFQADKLKNQFIRQVRLTTPFIVKSYLPKALSLIIEIGGVTESLFLSEVDTVSVYHIDSTHDLGIVIHMDSYKHTVVKFPRAEVFSTIAKSIDTKFSLVEALTFFPEGHNGPLCITVEKIMDAVSGSRALHISVPFLLYNCSGIDLVVSAYTNEKVGSNFILPSCYRSLWQAKQLGEKHGLALVTSENEIVARSPDFKSTYFTSRNHLNMSSADCVSNRNMICNENLPWKKLKSGSELLESVDNSNAEAHMYSPPFNCAASELMIRLSTHLPGHLSLSNQSSIWSTPFFLVSPAGSTIVAVPQPSTNGAFLVSVTSRPVVETFSARTRSVTFQPRYVISNASSREICFKQKGTEFFYRLEVGQHSHLHWADMTRELLVSIRFNEPGWDWSGSFLPDQLGDAQVKMRNYVSAALDMVRVEVQNANESIGDENIVGSSNGNSGTHLILLSDDNTGYMPYRIDNFTMEKLRIYQQKCETFETIVHSYSSSPYAWDEPCYPHRLIVEVPGERVLGSYNLDDVMECIHVHLPQTSEKPQRKLLLSIHAEGAMKVLSVVDSTHHVPRDVKVANLRGMKDKKKQDVMEKVADFTERITLHLSFIGISVINSSPQELVFACARDAKIEFQQSVNQQKFSFQVFSLQIDNQLRDAVYPVVLTFDHEHRGNLPIQSKNSQETIIVKFENASPIISETAQEPVICCTTAKWRNKNSSFISFEYINLRLAPVRIELEEQVVLNLFNFSRFVSSRIRSRNLKHSNSDLQILNSVISFNDHLENQIRCQRLPSVTPIGAPCQQIFLLARKQKKIYVEVLGVAPIKLTVSFSSRPWARRDGHMVADSLVLIGNTAFQRGLMALVNIEGAPIYLKQLTIAHHLASWDSIQEILVRHYTRQLLHEIYKVFGSAGVIGNPMGFARNVGLGIKDFLSVPAKGVLQSPTGLITGMAQGTKSLVNNTVYAVSNAATQFSKAAHQGIVAFTFDDQAVAKQQKKLDSHSGVLNEFLEGLTGFLQSPIKGAEKHGLPGVLSGIALGAAGLVARPVASILEVAGKTAQSIRNRSGPYPNRFRVRLPRPLARELPLLPYSWEEAIGIFMLLEAEESKFKDEIFVMCKALKLPGKFIVITERMFIIFSSSSLVGFGLPEFPGIADPDWVIEVVIGLEGVIHIDREEAVVNVVVKNPETLSKHQHTRRSSMRTRGWASPCSLPISQTSIELSNPEEAEDVLQTLRKMIELGKGQHWGAHILHRTTIR